jgi:hypothetical protein
MLMRMAVVHHQQSLVVAAFMEWKERTHQRLLEAFNMVFSF